MKAKVNRVIDGDTIEVTIRVRMARIDAPETKGKEKPMGLKTEALTEHLLEGQEVDLAVHGTDYYDRMLAEVYLDGVNINDKLVEQKMAEIYSPKNHNNGKLDI